MASRKLYAFGADYDARDVVVYAMADDGKVLASHFCSHVGFAFGTHGLDDIAHISSYPIDYRDAFHEAMSRVRRLRDAATQEVPDAE